MVENRSSMLWPRLRRLAIVTAVSGLCTIIVFGPAIANATPPLFVTKFTMQTTKTRQVAPLSRDNWGFVNEPVSFSQAGAHLNGGAGPDSLTTAFELENELVNIGKGESHPVPTADPKDIVVRLPQGLLGNPMATPRCELKQALSTVPCPPATQVGIAVLYMDHGEGLVGPIVNVVPEAGQSAEFAIETNHNISFLLTAHVVRLPERNGTPEAYGLAVVTNSIPMTEIYRVETSFWGVPAAREHDAERGLFCGRQAVASDNWGCVNSSGITGGEVSGEPEVPFLTMPSDCTAGEERATLLGDSWEDPGKYVEKEVETPLPTALTGSPETGFTGCNVLPFDPRIAVKPDTLLADAPVGLGVDLIVPQFEQPERNATPEIRKTVVAFPDGLSISPGIVDGIQACNATGPEGINLTGTESEEVGPTGELELAPGHCPDASILGTAEAESPLLAAPIKGHLYLARPGCGNAALGQNACTERDALDGNLYQMYLELGGKGALSNAGVNIKVRLRTEVNPATGQLTAVADEIAQLPFSELRIRLNGGPRAPLANPPACGVAVTSADITPWAAPGVRIPGLPDATPSSFFDIEGCGIPPALHPSFVAGTVRADAAKFSSFTLNLHRQDREQYVRGIQVHTPPGLLGMLAHVSLCDETDANTGTCPEASKIGNARVASGAGSHPFEVEGSIYLTGQHDGAPFGLSVVTNVVAGPFDLGKVVVRARVNVDQHDSSLWVTTDESGLYQLPQIVFGVPLRLQRISVNVDRPKFMFNPTNCGKHEITAEISGSGGALAKISSPFAVNGCKSLIFEPMFRVATDGHTSRAKGASLDVKLAYPRGAFGSDANVARVKVALPKQLPSYLHTLQKACIDATFEHNPAECPSDSIVGIARARTPLLKAGLEGPAYFVSHGGDEFPSLIIVLEGENIRVDLAGSTFIKKGITSSTFKTVPDVPVSSFELYLPEGRNHALAANGNLCKAAKKLVMPTEFVAQNGRTIHRRTKIVVSGCGKSNRNSGRSGRKVAAQQHHRKATARRAG